MKHNKKSIENVCIKIMEKNDDNIGVIVSWWTDKELEYISKKTIGESLFNKIKNDDSIIEIFSDVIIDADNIKLYFQNFKIQ